MKILVLGGSQFVGKHIVTRLLAVGHSVTVFNRGKSAPHEYPDVEHIIGDRDGGLSALGDRYWDVVVDVTSYVPRLCHDSADYLLNKVGRYCLISSISVYDKPKANGDETQDVLDWKKLTGEVINAVTYGPMKAYCEYIVKRCYPLNHLIIRPTYVIGPDDPTDRFNAWLRHINNGGKIVAPGKPSDLIQYIDVRDLAGFVTRLVSTSISGTFHAAGPKGQDGSWGTLLQTMQDTLGSRCAINWCPEEAMKPLGVTDTDFPLWVPKKDRNYFEVNLKKALDNGLILRPLEDSIIDAWQWEGVFGKPVNGLTPEKEKRLLQHIKRAQP